MTKEEREELEIKGRRMIETGRSKSIRVEGYLMRIRAYYERNRMAPSFESYASNWLAANPEIVEKDILRVLVSRFPKCRKRKIATGCSAWGTFGNPTCNYK